MSYFGGGQKLRIFGENIKPLSDESDNKDDNELVLSLLLPIPIIRQILSDVIVRISDKSNTLVALLLSIHLCDEKKCRRNIVCPTCAMLFYVLARSKIS